MKTTNPNHDRILGIAPSTRGVGFAVLEGHDTLVDWGVKSLKKGGKNKQSLALVQDLIIQYEPGTLVLEDTSATGSRKLQRIRNLGKQVIKLGKSYRANVKLYSRDQVMNAHIADGERTKHALAETIARRFLEELGSRLPPKRKPWESEDAKMAMFEGVALALMIRLKMTKRGQ